MPYMTATDKLFGTTSLSQDRAETIRKTYLLLGLSVSAALCGGYVGAQSDLLAGLFTGWIGWILAMVLLNAIPRVAIAARHNPVLGVSALVADGFVSGLVLAPILRFASLYAPGTIQIAMVMTVVVFGAVTAFVMSSGRTFSAPRGLMIGISISIIAAMVLNAFLNIGLLGILIAAGIGILGVCILVYATSDVLNNPEADSPIPGALILFAGLFNVFVAILNILLRLNRRR
ncbi:MAG TPA: Bax inhibitor-1 family protein [Bryobacteraceae bacterium]|jgi:modulator of FtsH protease